MFEKFNALLDLFRKGSEVANAEAWKSGQITGTLLAALLLALVHVAAAFGHPLPIDQATCDAIGAGVVAIANVLLTAATSKRAGLLPAKTEQPISASDPEQPDSVPTVAATTAPVPAPQMQSFRQGADGSIVRPVRDTSYIG